MRRYRTVIVIVLMGVVPMVAAVFVMRFILPAAEPEPVQATPPVQQAAPLPPPVVEDEPEEIMVLAAAQALPVGTLLAGEHLTEVGIEEGLVRRWHIETGSLGYDEMPLGYAVREAIAAGTPVSWSSLVGPRQRGFLAAVLKPGMRAITVRLGAGTRHSGLVDPGDRVDVVLTAQSRERGEQNALARPILEDVRVVAVDRRIASAAGSSDGGGEVERTEIATATLEVLPSQTGLLALGELEGELSLAVRPLAATGPAPEPVDVVDMRSLLALPQKSLQKKPVRIVRGSAVSDVTFAIEAQPSSPPKTVLANKGLEAARLLETSRTDAADMAGADGLSREPIDRRKPPVGEADAESVAGLYVSLAADTRGSDEPVAPEVEGLHALPAAGVDAGAELVQHLAGGVGLPGGAPEPALADAHEGQALLQERPQQMTVRVVRGSAVSDVTFGDDEHSASFPEGIPAEHSLAEGPGPQSPHALTSDRPGSGGDAEERIDRPASPAGETGPVPTVETALLSEADRQDGGEEFATADTEAAISPSVTDPEFSGELAQPLSAGVGLPDVAASEAVTENPVGPSAASFPENISLESGLAAAPDHEQLPVLAADRPRIDRGPDQRFELGTAPAGEAVPVPAARFAASPASPSFLSGGKRAEHDVAAAVVLDPMGALTAERSGPAIVPQQHVSPEAAPAGEAASAPAVQQANALALPSLPLQILSENGTAIAGGGALLLGWAGAFAWLRRQDRPLRRRLQAVGAPLTGYSAAEEIAPEESIFRATRPSSRLTWLWRRIERRYPLVDAPHAFPRLVGFGVLVAVVVWAGAWLMGMSGWWLTPAAALAGLVGTVYALGRMQARLEKQFIQRFPEIVDQIVRLAIAGLPPLEALTKVAEDAQPPVKGVLEEVSDALLAGLDADTALDMVAGRVRLTEFTLFAAVIRLQRRAGGSISGAFSNLANTLRERQTTAVKAKAATAQTRLTLLVLILMPPLVLAMQTQIMPESVDLLFNTEDGQQLLQLGVGLIVAGLFLARTIAARGSR